MSHGYVTPPVVAVVLEGLPTDAATTLALGVRSMKQHRVVIYHIDAVETLGCIQTICFDKTGTITQNTMAVVRLYSGRRDVRVVNNIGYGSRVLRPKGSDQNTRDQQSITQPVISFCSRLP